MKTIIFYVAIIGILSGGIYYYVQTNNEASLGRSALTATLNEKKEIQSLTQPITIVHPEWSDNLVPVPNEPGRVKRETRDDAASIVDLTDSSITIIWDAWGVEQFNKGADGKYTLYK